MYKLRILDGDEAFYFRHDKDGNLEGMVSSHVDDFVMSGTKEFLEEITNKIVQKLEISKLEDNEFRFTGMDVKKEQEEEEEGKEEKRGGKKEKEEKEKEEEEK